MYASLAAVVEPGARSDAHRIMSRALAVASSSSGDYTLDPSYFVHNRTVTLPDALLAQYSRAWRAGGVRSGCGCTVLSG